ncbi:hypothetical protein SSX86_022628 [Deinandra increscens subsp. villosa]|uniref:Uncharacterized protein n=1 Tax=Deinandra increscens subsp. villosa TaxID=3103831 RepID=A0AAP0CJE4_9ASTR
MAKRTVTMNWDHLDDFNGEDDEFFESTNRLSVVVPLDMPLPEFDEDDDGLEFNDSRVSFSHNLASISIKEPQNVVVATVPSNQYDMWMVAPGSITDRRRRLLQGMGLNSNKDFARLTSTNTTKFNKPCSKRLVSIKPSVTTSPIDTTKSNENPIVDSLEKESSQHLQESKQVEPEWQSHAQTKAQPKPHDKTEPQPKPQPQELEPQPESEAKPKLEPKLEPEPEPQSQQQAQVQDHVQASTQPIFLVRCRSDSDIETSSFNIKRRKEDMIGLVSKQRLTRTSSLVTPSVGLSCQYANVLRVYTPNTKLPKSSFTSATKNKKKADRGTSSAKLDSFFLIKNLDTGKEFVVKEFNNEGMWNKVSDLQTGKQLTMDEFENTVGHSPVVKELMRRNSRKRNGGINSYLSKSFRSSKKMGSAILKTLKGSVTGSKTEKEKAPEGVTAATTTPAPRTTTLATDTSLSSSSLTREQHKTTVEHTISTDKNPNSEWVKAKAYGKPTKEFSAYKL